MKKHMRLIAILMTIVFCCAMVLAGCGGGGGATEGEGDGAPAGDKTEIVIGVVEPLTGPLSVFPVAFDWVSELALAEINAEGGIFIEAYDKNLPVRLIVRDSESDPNKASEVATQLVLNDKVDILAAQWTPDTANPVSAVGERYQIPTLISNCPADSWLTGGPYEWASGIMFYGAGLLSDYVDAWDKLDTNKKVGYIFDSEVDGVTFSGAMNEILPARGYTVVDPGRFPMSTTDYTSIINQLKEADVDIVVGNQIAPNFTTFWQQCHQLNFIPKVMTIGKAEHFEADVIALGGGIGNGIMSEVLWDKSFPYTSPLLNLSAAEISEKWETEKGTQFPATLGYDVALFEVLADALSRCADLEPATINEAIIATDIDSIYGHLKFDENRVAPVPCVTVQWIEGTEWEFEKIIVGAGSTPGIPTVDPIIIPDANTGK